MFLKNVIDYHFDCLVAGEVSEQILANDVGLLVKPFALKHIAFFGGGLAHFY